MSLDLLVLGAGPAGIAIASLMARKGFRVEIVDPAFFPRTKICGEFLNPQAVRWLQDHGLLSSLLELNPFPVYGMKITDHQGVAFTGHYFPRGQESGYAIQRKHFDALMVTKARETGIVISEGHRAEKLLFDGDRVAGVCGTDAEGKPFERRATVTIGADGRNNLIGRTFGWMRQIRDLRKYAFVTYFKNLPGLENFGEVHLVENGYVGVAPLGESLANVALVVDERACPTADVNYEEYLLQRLLQSPLASRFEGLKPVAAVAMTGPLAFEMKRTSGHGTLLVGDACGFIDPFTGEGINYAFLSANLAARVLEQAFHSRCFEDQLLASYDYQRKMVFGKKFQLVKLLQKAIEWPAVSSFLVKRFAKSLNLGDTIVSAVGSAIPLEQVWNLRFLARVVGGK